MCGIIGYMGNESALNKVIEGLYQLEYRGYDSAGVALLVNGNWEVSKCKGRVSELENSIKLKDDDGIGLGHTRWATHGEPTSSNAHPHESNNVIIVHNGIIENYFTLKEFLKKEGYKFNSDTDSEVVAHLLDYCYEDDEIKTINKVINMLKGSYALIIAFKNIKDRLFAIRKDNPLLVATSKIGNFLTSDITATIKYTKTYYHLDTNEIVVLGKDFIYFYKGEKSVEKKQVEYNLYEKDSDKGEYAHYMLKEINMQPDVLDNLLKKHIVNNNIKFESIPDVLFYDYKKIHIVACGTAYNAGLIGKRVIEKLAKLEVEVHLASEFRYIEPLLNNNHLVIVISQSGETADTIAALRLARDQKCKVLAICNVISSTIAKEADYLIYTDGGVEIAVASTKAYTLQIASLYLLAIKLATLNQNLNKVEAHNLINKLLDLPLLLKETLKKEEDCSLLSSLLYTNSNIFFLGRGLDYPVVIEGSLKMKEISYIHSEALASGELKHGTISLITKGTPVISVITQKEIMGKSISNLKEVKARGANVITISSYEDPALVDVSDHLILLPIIDDLFSPFVSIIILQLLAYYFTLYRGNDVDKPRNLAKSVTVE